MSLEKRVKDVIRDVPDFPKPGIIFKDITPILTKPDLVNDILDQLAFQLFDLQIDGIAGIESRGFLFAPALAAKLRLPFHLIRKKGKLPGKKIEQSYQLESGEDIIEMHEGFINKGDNILIHDDLLATGGTAAAAAQLIKKQSAKVAGFSFLVNLSFLDGVEKLEQHSSHITTIVNY